MRLILAPHADDETLGCGGLLAKYPGDCFVAVLARVDAARGMEFREAMMTLGVPLERTFLGHGIDGRLDEDMPALVATIDDLCRTVVADELYVPYPGTHQDHVAVYEAGLRAARISLNPTHRWIRNVFVYWEPVAELEIASYGLRWNTFESIGEVLEAKVCAASAYRSQMLPGNGGGVRAQAEALGALHGMEAAEQFCAIRVTRS